MITAHRIFQEGLKKFGAVSTKINNIVFVRLSFLRVLFFVSWNSFPLIWVLSSTGLCAISEDNTVCKFCCFHVFQSSWFNDYPANFEPINATAA
eukprot:2055485-Rhodomonas_salina.1